MKATKFCKQKCCFLTFFCPADRPRAVPDKLQKASVKELVVDNSTNNSSFNTDKISVFTDPKDRQVKHYYPNKKTVVTLSIGSGQKEFLRVRRNQHIFLLSTWNLYLREIIFVTDVEVLTIETFLIEKKLKSSCLNRSF